MSHFEATPSFAAAFEAVWAVPRAPKARGIETINAMARDRLVDFITREIICFFLRNQLKLQNEQYRFQQ
jgi:hypothetical protein